MMLKCVYPFVVVHTTAEGEFLGTTTVEVESIWTCNDRVHDSQSDNIEIVNDLGQIITITDSQKHRFMKEIQNDI